MPLQPDEHGNAEHKARFFHLCEDESHNNNVEDGKLRERTFAKVAPYEVAQVQVAE